MKKNSKSKIAAGDTDIRGSGACPICWSGSKKKK